MALDPGFLILLALDWLYRPSTSVTLEPGFLISSALDQLYRPSTSEALIRINIEEERYFFIPFIFKFLLICK